MSRSRSWRLAVLALALAVANTPSGWSDEQKTTKASTKSPQTLAPQEVKIDDKSDLTCAVYALAELADDPNLGKWIAETIPAVIQQGTWYGNVQQGRRTSYYV